jgi:hypothetical protein
MQARILVFAGVVAAMTASPAAWSQQDATDEEALERAGQTAESEAAAAAAIQAQVEAARGQMEAARVQLERAAREVAIQTRQVQVDESGIMRIGAGPGSYTVFAGGGARARMGASLVDAEGGALVTAVAPESGAADAGLKVGDVIRSIDGIALTVGDIQPATEVVNRLAAIEPGATVELVVERDGASLDVHVVTEEGPPSPYIFNTQNGQQVYLRTDRLARNGERAADRAAAAAAPGGQIFLADGNSVDAIRLFNLAGAPWGDMEIVPITPELGRYFQTTEGMLVVRAPSEEDIGLQDGDVILTIGGRTPTSAEHAIRILGSFEPGEVIEFALMRDGRRQPLQYTVEDRGFRFFSPATIGAGTAPAAAPAAPAAPGAPGARGRGPAPAPTAPAPAPVSPTSP